MGAEALAQFAIPLGQFFRVCQLEAGGGLDYQPHFVLVGTSLLPRQFIEMLPHGIQVIDEGATVGFIQQQQVQR